MAGWSYAPAEQAPWVAGSADDRGPGRRSSVVLGGLVGLAVVASVGWFGVPLLLDDDAQDARAPAAAPEDLTRDRDPATTRPSAAAAPTDDQVPSPSPEPEPSSEPEPIPVVPPVPSVLSPVSVTATCVAPPALDSLSQTVTYDPEHTLDGDPTTAWRCPGSAVGHRLVYSFAQPVTVTSVGLVPGYDKIDPADGIDRFTENRTVSGVAWSLDDGTSYRQDIPQPTRSMTVLEVTPDATSTTLSLEIVSTGNDGARRDFTPISDVRFTGY